MLYCQEVIDAVRRSAHPMTTRTVARRLGLRRRVVRASLVHAKNCLDPRLEVVPAVSGETAHRHAVWRYRAGS